MVGMALAVYGGDKSKSWKLEVWKLVQIVLTSGNLKLIQIVVTSGKAVEKLWKSCGKAVEKLWKSCGKAVQKLGGSQKTGTNAGINLYTKLMKKSDTEIHRMLLKFQVDLLK